MRRRSEVGEQMKCQPHRQKVPRKLLLLLFNILLLLLLNILLLLLLFCGNMRRRSEFGEQMKCQPHRQKVPRTSSLGDFQQNVEKDENFYL